MKGVNMSDKKDETIVSEDEKKLLLDHNYDGIKELDNPLPNWWLVTFFLTILFGVPYYMAHTFFGAQSIQDELSLEMSVVTKKQEAYEEKQGRFNLEEYNAYIAGEVNIEKIAAKTFRRKCKACHGAAGEGSVGPNLTDNYWLHGDGSIETVYNTINKGVVDKGMEAWVPKIGKQNVYAVLKYVMELRGTNPPNPKEPQGKEYN